MLPEKRNYPEDICRGIWVIAYTLIFIAGMIFLTGILTGCGRQQAGCSVTYTTPTQVSAQTCPYGSAMTGTLGNGIIQCSTISVACDKAAQ